MGKPYSYHTFILPFEIKEKGKKFAKKDVKDVVNTKYWEKVQEDTHSSFYSVFLDKEELKDREKIYSAIAYNQRQYFHDNVLKAIHSFGKDDIVTEYKFKFNDEFEKTIELETNRLCILSIGEENKKFRYILKVSNIRLKAYNTGIHVLILELYNDLYKTFKNVKEINELGRRISLPYIANKNGGIACAESVNWKFLGNIGKYDFRKANEEIWENDKNINDIYKIDFLDKIMIEEEDRNIYEIQPSLDDRMFTCSVIQNNYLSNIFKLDYDISASEEERYKELSKRLYEYIYIDKEGDYSAATFSFRKNILNESIYSRWSEYGTVYGVSHTSLVAITGESESLDAKIIRPFLTQYVEIAILAIVQRASILRFQRQSSGNLENKDIQDLQKRYINYRNQLHFFEVSSQEQGIELYELIRKQLYIEKEIESLEKNLEILYEKSNVDMSNKIGAVGIFIAAISLIGTLFDLIAYFRQYGCGSNFLMKFFYRAPENIICICAFSYILYLIYKYKKKD